MSEEQNEQIKIKTGFLSVGDHHFGIKLRFLISCMLEFNANMVL